LAKDKLTLKQKTQPPTMKANGEKADCIKIPHWRGFGSNHKGSLKRETLDVWKWYLEFFKEVIRLDSSAEDPTLGQTREPPQGYSEYSLPIQLSYAQEGSNAKVKITRDKTVDTYAFSNPMPVASGWFISGKRLKEQQSDDLRLNFIVEVYFDEQRLPEPFGSVNSLSLNLTIGVKVYVGKRGRLNSSDAQSVLPWVKAEIVHELRHLWNRHYFPATDPINKSERIYVSGERPREYNFEEWLQYFGETKELSPRADQIASYARDKRACATEAFKAIVNYKIEIKGAAAMQKGEKFEGSMEELVRKLIRKQVVEFNKRYPRNQITLKQVLPDKGWFLKFGSSLFSMTSDSSRRSITINRRPNLVKVRSRKKPLRKIAG
jgi:hypothetical protein